MVKQREHLIVLHLLLLAIAYVCIVYVTVVHNLQLVLLRQQLKARYTSAKRLYEGIYICQ